jgi:hypothetical protein
MKSHHAKESSEWPYRSFLIFGFFGIDSPGGKALMKYSVFALALFISGVAGTSFFSEGIPLYTSSLLIPISVLILVWSNSEYIKKLDTLTQLLQLKAFAFAYGAAVFIAFSIYCIQLSTGYSISPIWLVLAEPLRGLSLYLIAKDYE